MGKAPERPRLGTRGGAWEWEEMSGDCAQIHSTPSSLLSLRRAQSLFEQPPLCLHPPHTPSPPALDSPLTVAEASSCGHRFLRCLFLSGPHPHPLPCLGKQGFLKPEWGAKPHSALGEVSGPESLRRLDHETGRTGSAALTVPCPPGTRLH